MIYALGVIGVSLAGSLIGTSFLPGEWYQALNKPSFTPAPWVFGPVWSVLYAIIGWVGARKYLLGGARGLWLAQMGVNLIWSPVFFGMHSPLGGTIVIAALWGLIVAFIAREWNNDRTSAVLFLPYIVWVSLASAVNLGVVVLN